MITADQMNQLTNQLMNQLNVITGQVGSAVDLQLQNYSPTMNVCLTLVGLKKLGICVNMFFFVLAYCTVIIFLLLVVSPL